MQYLINLSMYLVKSKIRSFFFSFRSAGLAVAAGAFEGSDFCFENNTSMSFVFCIFFYSNVKGRKRALCGNKIKTIDIVV